MVGDETGTNVVLDQNYPRLKPIPFPAHNVNKENLKNNCNGFPGYEFLSSKPLDFPCLMCKQTLDCKVCGHRTCSPSYEKARGIHPRCPVLRANMKTSEEKSAERVLTSLQATCKHSSLGCQWTGEVKELEKHLADICEYQLVRCTIVKCWSVVLRKDLQAHVQNCEWRPVKCSYCPSMTTNRNMEKHHRKCSGFPLVCTNGCEKRIARREISRHTDVVKGDCPMTDVPCKYERIGCLTKVKRKRLGQHMSTAQGDHLELMNKWLKAVEKENSDLKQRVQMHEQHLSNQTRQIAMLKKALATNSRTLQIC